MRRNGCGMRAGAAAAVAGLLLLLLSAPAWASESPRPRVAFDRQGGFVVQQGEEASVTATLVGGSGGMWFHWEGNNAGAATGDGGATFVIDTSVPGDYWLRAVGGSDGTDGDYAGKIRFRVAAKAVAAKGMRAAGAGETLVWSEDFSGMTSGSSTVIDYNGWTGDKCYNVSNSVRLGSSNGGGYVTSPTGTLGGCAGRLEFSMWRHDSGAAATLQRSVDGGGSWIDLAAYSSAEIPASSQAFSVDVPASETVMFKWANDAGKKRFYLDDVALYAASAEPEENQPPVLDLDPDVAEVEVFLGKSFELEVTATEYDGDEITLSASGEPVTADTWEAENGTGSATGFFIWTPQTTGTWNVVFTATDKDGTTNRAVAITVVPEGPGTLEFGSEGVHVRESAGTVTLTVERTGGAAGAVTVAWATADGTASAGSEYVAGGGALAFADGQTEATLSVALLDDTSAEENKSFSVVLGNVTGGASLGDATTCTVTIVDDDDANASYYASCYKNGVLKTGDDLKDALCRIINTGVKTNGYGSNLDTILKVTDVNSTNGNSSAVRCIYLQSGITSFNKEHIWAQSHGIDESGPAYSDLHHIRACNSTMNSTRGDKDFDNRQTVSGATEKNGCWYTSKAWEPPDAAKGDVARAVLYMDVRYENKYNSKVDLEAVDSIGTSTDGNQLGKLSTLIAWNELDPPDDFERRRNELIYTTYQYNRNPFIDHPTWVRAVFDPDNFQEEAISWTVNVTVEGAGWVNNQDAAFTASVTNNMTKTFNVVPDASAYHHIGSISWNGVLVPQAYYTNAAYYNYTCPAVTNNSTLAVVFAADTAARGTPVWWLAEYGTNSTALAQEDWAAAELEDWNDDGVPNWQEYLDGTDPTALSLRQVTGVAVAGETADGFTVSWNAVDYADGYRVRVCETARVAAAAATFEGGAVDAGWSVSASGTTVATNAAMDGTWGLSLGTNGAWLAWGGDVENPAAVTFRYKRSSNTAAWTLEAQVSSDGGATWTTAGSVTDATTSAKAGEIDLSAWAGKTVRVRLADARESGNAARYVDSVTIWRGGGTAAEGTTAATAWTATGLAAGTAYDVFVRAEATTLGVAAGPWSAAVRAETLSEEDTRAEQSIAFPEIADQVVGAAVALQATASSGLAVEYAASGPAEISGATLTCAGSGTVTVTASQPGNGQWKPAADVTRTFEVTEPELSAPSAVWASATNATGFTAAWSAVDGAMGYELSVWTQTEGGSVAVTNEAVLFGTNFASITGNGNGALTNGFIEGWSCLKAYGGTNEIRVGASSALGWVQSAETGATGTVRVVTRARAWSNDTSVVLWVGVTGCESQGNALSLESAVFTNDFENVAGAMTVCWSNATASKQRFFLEEVSVTELSAGAGGGGGAVPVPGYDPLEVTGTSWAVTGLEAATAYGFHVRATAGTTEGGWSDAVGVTTLAAEPELLPQSITFPEIGTQVATNSVALAATAGSGLAVSYTVAGPASLAGNVLTFTGAGTVSVTASQAGNDEWAPAEDVTRTFAVVKAAQSIDFPALAGQSVGDTVTLHAAASSGLTVSYTVSGPATLEDGVLTCTGAGTVTVTASQSGNDFYEAATPVERSFEVSLVPQTIDFATIGNQTATATVALSATASSGLEVSFAVTGGPAEVNGSTLTFTGAGEVTVTATQAGNTMYAPASASHTFMVVKASQTITFDAIAGQSVTDTVSLEATSSSGLEVSYTVSGPATLSGTSLCFTGAGTVTVTAHQPGNALWAAASDVVQEFAVSLLAQTIDFPEIAAQVATNTVTLTATATSGLEVTFAVMGDPAVLDGSTLTFTGAGEVTVTATQAGNEIYTSASASQTFTVSKASQSIDFPAPAGQSVGDTVTLTATASSSLTVSYTVTGPATLNGTTLTCTGAGTVTVTASQDGNALYDAAPSVVQSFEVSLLSQTIEFDTIGDQVATNVVTISATATSGLDVTFAVTSGPAVLDGNVLSFTGGGDVTVTATQAGNESYEAATASQTFAVAKAVAAVTLSGLSQTYDGEAKAVTVTTEPEGLAVDVTYDGAMEAPTLVGSYLVAAMVDDAIWSGSAEGTLEIGKAAQNIDFAAIGDQITTNTVALSATADSGLEVTFEVTSGPAALDGNVLSFMGSGTVVVTASQAGYESYEAATASQTFTVAKALAEVTLAGLSQTYDGEGKAVTVTTEPEGLAVVVTYDEAMEAPRAVGSYAAVATVDDAMWAGSAEGTLVIGKASQSIAFAEIGDQIATNTVVLSATATSGLEVTFEVTSGPAALDGNVLTFTGSGSVVVTANQVGNESYEAATASQTFAVAKAVAEVTLSGLSQTYDGEAKAVTATTEPEGLAVVVTYGGSTELPSAVGSYAVMVTVEDARWAGNTEGTLVIGKASQSIDFAAIDNQIATNTVELSATASSGLEVLFEVTSGPAVLDGNVLSFTGSGTVVVTASQAGDESYEAATASQTFEVVKATAEVTLAGLSQTYDGEAKAVTVTTEPEGLAVVVTYDGNVEPPSAVGSYAVRAMVDDAMWAGSAEGTLEIGKASQNIDFDAIGDQITTNTVVLSAMASSGLEVTFEVTSGLATLDGNVLSFTGVGEVTVTATQAGNESYEAVMASQTFMVVEPEPEKSAYEVWLEGQGLSVTDYPESSDLDGDEDGMSNWAEYVADTDPSDSHEFFAISVGAWVGDDLTLAPNPVSSERVYSVVYWTNMLASPQTNVLGRGFDSLSIVTNVPTTWFGTIRVGLP